MNEQAKAPQNPELLFSIPTGDQMHMLVTAVTLRDVFAAAALASGSAVWDVSCMDSHSWSAEEIADRVYTVANEMLKRRQET